MGTGDPAMSPHPGIPSSPARGWMESVIGNSTTPAGIYMQMFRNMGGAPVMGSGMGVGMTDNLAIGSDGTAYVIRPIAPTTSASGTTASWQFELDAISPADGSVKWKLQISGGRVSGPVLAADGLIYLTVDNYQKFYANFNFGGLMMTQAQAQASDGQVLVISASAGSASIMHTIQTSSNVLSAPRIVTDPSGGYMVYVLGYDMMDWSSPSTSFAPAGKTLYACLSDGSMKFSTKLP